VSSSEVNTVVSCVCVKFVYVSGAMMSKASSDSKNNFMVSFRLRIIFAVMCKIHPFYVKSLFNADHDLVGLWLTDKLASTMRPRSSWQP